MPHSQPGHTAKTGRATAGSAAPAHRPPARLDDALRRGAARAARDTVRAGAERYDRARHLPRLIRAVPGEFEGDDAATGAAIVARLTHALAAERRRARGGHWSYDLNRHIALMQALAAERARLADGGADKGKPLPDSGQRPDRSP